jgi:hypothetical protein
MITITGVVFAVILAPIISRMDPASLGDFIGDRSPIKLFFSAMLHYYIPFAVIVDWVFFAKKKQYRIKATIIWFVYPFSYIIMVYIRASIVGPVLSQYIYPFFNPTTMGKWLIPFILLLWVFFTGVSFLYVYLDQKLNEKTSI